MNTSKSLLADLLLSHDKMWEFPNEQMYTPLTTCFSEKQFNYLGVQGESLIYILSHRIYVTKYKSVTPSEHKIIKIIKLLIGDLKS